MDLKDSRVLVGVASRTLSLSSVHTGGRRGTIQPEMPLIFVVRGWRRCRQPSGAYWVCTHIFVSFTTSGPYSLCCFLAFLPFNNITDTFFEV